MKLFFRWVVTSLAIFMVPHLVSGVTVDGLGAALATAALLGVLNVLVRPLLILLTLPLTVISLGFFLLVVNALVFELAGSLISGVHIASFGAAFFASLIVSLVSWLINRKWRGRVVFYQGTGTAQPPRSSRSRGDDTIDLEQGPGGRWS